LLCLIVFTGINASALFVIEDSRIHIAPFLARGFSLVFTGHSLGAGTAALAAAHARSGSEDGYKDATAVTFACPGIISGKASIKAMKTFVTTFIYGFDVVPRASGVAIFKLLDRIFSNNWKEKTMEWMAEEAKKKVLEKMGTGVLGSIAGGILSSTQTPAKKKKKLKQPAQVQPEIEEGNA
jgi:ABC-type proline/glycine betaine transport system substrate-binding protein